MLRSELNDLFNKFKEVHQRLLSFAAGGSEESFDLNHTQEEYNALKVELLENASRLTKDQSEYLEKARTVLRTPRFKLQRIRSRSSSRSWADPKIQSHNDSSSSSSRDLSFSSTFNPTNSSIMDDGKETEKSADKDGVVSVGAAGTSSSLECVRRARLLEIRLEMEEDMEEMEDEKLQLEDQRRKLEMQKRDVEKKKRERRRALLRKAVAEGFVDSVIDDLSKDGFSDKSMSNPDPLVCPPPPAPQSLPPFPAH